MSGIAKRIAGATLEAVRQLDPNSRVAAVSTLDDGQTLIRVSSEDSTSLLEGLRKRLPLATVCSIQNVSTGLVETQVLVDDEDSLLKTARHLAGQGRVASRVAFAAKILLLSGALAFSVLVSLKLALL